MAYGSELSKLMYYRSPLAIKNAIATAYGFRQRCDRYGDDFQAHLNFLEDSQYWDNGRLENYNNEKTVEFVNKVISECNYYRRRESYQTIESVSELDKFPILTKELVRKNVKELHTGLISRHAFRWVHTSGTTGKSLIFPVSKNAFQREYAFRALHYSWGEAYPHLRERIAYCAGHPVARPERKKPPFWVHDRANNWLLLSSYHMNEMNLKSYIEKLEEYNPKMIGGYPSSLYLLAIANKKYGSGKLRVNSVFCASETLFGHQQDAMEESFQCKAFNWYGNTELCGNIVECEEGELHLKYEHSKVEILERDNTRCKPGGTGRVVCTGFGNLAFPLIRYEVGDMATLAKNQKSKCGRGGILIDRVEGRKEDYIVTGDRRLVGRLDHIFKDSSNVIEGQIFQEIVGDVVLRVVKTTEYSRKDEEQLFKEARLRLGPETDIHFTYVDSIQRTANGKFPFVVSHLDLSKIQPNLSGTQRPIS